MFYPKFANLANMLTLLKLDIWTKIS